MQVFKDKKINISLPLPLKSEHSRLKADKYMGISPYKKYYNWSNHVSKNLGFEEKKYFLHTIHSILNHH